MKNIPLSPEVRKRLVAKAIQIDAATNAELGIIEEPISAKLLESMDDHGLRVFADDFTGEEWADMERNSDWVADLEEKQKEADRAGGKPEMPRAPSPFDKFADPDHRTATERGFDAVGLPRPGK
jgi:hypothetical protein